MSTIAHHAALTAPLTVNGMTVDELLAFHKARFGDARMEADGDGADAGDATAISGDTASTDASTADATTNATATTWNPDAWDGKVETLPSGAQQIIKDLRKADGDERVAKKTLDAIQKALNPDAGEGEKVDPVKLAQQLADSQNSGQATQATLKSTQIELAVFKAATAAGADPAALTDSRTFMTKASELDPTANDFADKVKSAVDDAVKNNPKLKAARAAGASGADHAGGSGEGAAKPTTLEDAIAKRMAQ